VPSAQEPLNRGDNLFPVAMVVTALAIATWAVIYVRTKAPSAS
jgi:hypothetical protein